MNPLPDELACWRPVVAPRSAYVHIPFCRRRCGYCNFALVADRDYLVDRFLDTLAIEIGWLEQEFELDTLFLGGGTPSHLTPDQLDVLKQIILSRFRLASDAEVTAECNPNDLDSEKSAALEAFGVNRISMGVQSLDPEKLKRLERQHLVADVRAAFENVRPWTNSISLDLIFAAPGETLFDWENDLQSALSFQPDHVSTYELTFEKGTTFWNRQLRGELNSSDEDLRTDMYLAAIERLESAGLAAYEVSSFSRPGHRCRHNEIYWTGKPYFAFGPGASRFVDGRRETNHPGTLQYIRRIESRSVPTLERERLPAGEAAKERLAIGLRRVDGVERDSFARATGFTIESIVGEKIQRWLAVGLIEPEGNHLRLTLKGRLVCDWISAEIMACDPGARAHHETIG